MTKHQIDGYFDQYCKRILAIAENDFHVWILPFMRRKQYSFIAGNGEYFIRDKNNKPKYSEDLPKYIRKVLDMEIPGLPANTLGTLMPNYDPEKDK